MRTLSVCLFLGALALCRVNAAAPAVAGVWEATKDGRKAVTLKVHETDGILGGTLIVYIIHDGGTGEHDGAASEPLPLAGTTWDGRTLRFSVNAPGASVPAFELRLTGADKGELTCARSDGSVEVASVTRQK
jgi:hypothetical protein